MNELALAPSHDKSDMSLFKWLESQNIPFIAGVDTRALTKHLRSKGTMPGAIGVLPTSPKDMKLVDKIISIDAPETFNRQYKKKVILVDCGAKETFCVRYVI